jgi:hypothetical protein
MLSVFFRVRTCLSCVIDLKSASELTKVLKTESVFIAVCSSSEYIGVLPLYLPAGELQLFVASKVNLPLASANFCNWRQTWQTIIKTLFYFDIQTLKIWLPPWKKAHLTSLPPRRSKRDFGPVQNCVTSFLFSVLVLKFAIMCGGIFINF